MKKWKARVQDVYSSPEELQEYDKIFKIARRCGYIDTEKLWADNPTISGSVNPRDFGIEEKQ